MNLFFNSFIRSTNNFIHSSTGNYSTFTTNNETRFIINNLKEKTMYQICIATIDNRIQTSKFKCEITRTDFIFTGPVTNVSATSESDKINISWSLPQFKYDIPQAYIIHLSGGEIICRIFIIKMVYNKNIQINI